MQKSEQTAGERGAGPLTAAFSGLLNHRRHQLSADLVAGLIVAVMLVPQAMAYALLAGLPPEVGLYASVVPVALYAFLGTSNTLAVGPVAIVSLLVFSGVSRLAEVGSAEYLGLALLLALCVGVIQAGMGLVRAGFLVNFLSHAVLAGFTSGAAIVILASQARHLIGVDVGRPESLVELLTALFAKAGDFNPAALLLGAGSLAVLLLFRFGLVPALAASGLSSAARETLSKLGPFVVVAVATGLTFSLRLDESSGLAVVGTIPRGLPRISVPTVELSSISALLPTALAISFIGFVESFAIAKVLAARRREKVSANRELVALGVANIGAAFSGGYPVTGGFSRSMVSFAAGARSRLTALSTAALVALALLLLTPLFFYLPKAVLAAIIVLAVAGLIDWRGFARSWKYSRADGVAFLVTFSVVLAAGVERGIVVGAIVALLLHLWRTTKPHVAIVGRVGATEHYRNVNRHPVQTWPELLLVRIDESLYFGNSQQLEQRVLAAVADQPEVEHFVLIASAVNFIDGSALDTLETLRTELSSAGVTFHLAEVKGPVMDRLERVSFLDTMGEGRVFLSTEQAVQTLASRHQRPPSPIRNVQSLEEIQT